MTRVNDTERGPRKFDFRESTAAGLVVFAGGFEQRSLTFAEKLRKSRCSFQKSLILSYESQKEDNQANLGRLRERITLITGATPEVIGVNAHSPVRSCVDVRKKIEELCSTFSNNTALIDISGMTHLWALATIHACVACGLKVSVVYTEARWYFPRSRQRERVIKAWRNRSYDVAAQYLQSAGLKASHVLPDFAGNFRPGHQTCLIIFAGYEPNRIEAR